MMNEILEKLGLKYEDLNAMERETLLKWNSSVQRKQINLSDVLSYVQDMRSAVEKELTSDLMDNPSFWSFMFRFRKEYGLKARLKNYMLLEAMLESPQKAQKAIEDTIAGLVSNIK